MKCVEADVKNRLNEIISRLGKENTEQFIKSIHMLEQVIKDIITKSNTDD